MGHLPRPQVHRDLCLECLVDLVHVVHHQHVLGGDRAVGFQLEAPVTIRVLSGQQCLPSPIDRSVEPIAPRGTDDRKLAGLHVAGWGNHQSTSVEISGSPSAAKPNKVRIAGS